MQIKTFRALDMHDALRAVKEELGPDAVILSTREVKSGGGAFGLFSRAVVEVTAAVDRGGARRLERGLAGTSPGARGRGDERDEMGSGNQYRSDVHEDRAAILSHGRLVRGWENLQNSQRPEPARANAPFSEHLQDASGLQAIREDLAMIKQELSDLR